jgi:hypothetical protein
MVEILRHPAWAGETGRKNGERTQPVASGKTGLLDSIHFI